MRADIEPSTCHIGLALCFILVAYISYHLGYHRPALASYLNAKTPWLTSGISLISPATRDGTPNSPDDVPTYVQGLQDGTQQALLKFDYHDMKREVRQSRLRLENREKELKEKLVEVEAREKKRHKWFEENVKEIKSMREQQIASAWNQKQEREKGIFGWLRVGARRKASNPGVEKRDGTVGSGTHQQGTVQLNNWEKDDRTISRSDQRSETLDAKVSVWLNEKEGGI
ncbi:hypothetical protein BJ875DRAFT_463050 [Amylocarpus encephaloides]|uniref:Uncharacterized protein n=1 Tax=Amylocarpus encephaloides TaxID=45428 RepID=A0A9P7YIZ0_9HELO|nr:hypothetical protein BJ875DRAFT_463050 [Amylocarpus encephaloides]